MELSKYRKNVKLDRFCFVDDVSIDGGVELLFDKCLEWTKDNGFSQVIAYSDNRYSQENVYERLKFRLDKEIKPDYNYVDLSKGSSSPVFPKQSIKDKTLMENYGKIYDCGKKRYLYSLANTPQ